MPKFSLLASPTSSLSPDEAEVLDISILLVRMSLYKFVGKDSVLLSQLFPSSTSCSPISLIFVLELELPDVVLPLLPSRKSEYFQYIHPGSQITASGFARAVATHLKAESEPPFIAVLNAPRASFADWFIYFPCALKIPVSLKTMITKPNTRQQRRTLPDTHNRFVILGQSKRYYRTALTASIIQEEINKVVKNISKQL